MVEIPLKTMGYVPSAVALVALKLIVLVQFGEHAVGEKLTDTPAGSPLDVILTNSLNPKL